MLVTVLVALNWREIYHAFRPEARFWGRWRMAEWNHTLPDSLSIDRDTFADTAAKLMELAGKEGAAALWEFGQDGRMGSRLETSGFTILVEIGGYRVTRDRIMLSTLDSFTFNVDDDGDGDFEVVEPIPTFTTAWECRYRFENDDELVLVNFFGDEETLTLRRLRQHGDTDD